MGMCAYEKTIAHLLGYLTPEQWTDAIERSEELRLDKDAIYELMKEQEHAYRCNLIGEVER